ncbi:unnamed protein product [Ostreobium quekettii]|uniref:4-hydroxy-tetrahydrodipicolinate synthase n=1 Tax=Ostreobium quekettii TaxID=121088 RepID=A0A8S1J317_9CHLO|nr:unnamed protein product [Ostreobium quekettii]
MWAQGQTFRSTPLRDAVGWRDRTPRSPPCRPRAHAVLAPEMPSQKQERVPAIRKAALLTAIKTPYLPSGKCDLVAFDAMVRAQVEAGVDGVIIGGTTGEGHLMSWDEHIMLIAHTANVFSGEILVVGNTGSNSTREALHASHQGFAVGMDAALHINPYYGKTSREGLLAHFRAALSCGPGILYNVPSRTGQDIPEDVIIEAAEHKNFLGVKECTGNARIAARADKGIGSWSGNDDEAHEARHNHGAFGVISVTSNLVPGLFSRLMHGGPQPELAASLQGLMAWLFCEPNPIPLNTALAMCGLARPVFRLPYVPLCREKREEGAALLREFREHIPGCREVRVMEDDEFVCLEEF